MRRQVFIINNKKATSFSQIVSTDLYLLLDESAEEKPAPNLQQTTDSGNHTTKRIEAEGFKFNQLRSDTGYTYKPFILGLHVSLSEKDSLGNMYGFSNSDLVVYKVKPDKTYTVYADLVETADRFVIDPFGNIYTFNETTKIIRKYDTNGLSSIHGNTGSEPADMVCDPMGNLFISDDTDRNIIKIDTNGQSSIFVEDTDWYARGLNTDSLGNVYYKNGATEIIYKITPDGQSSVFLSSASSSIYSFNIDVYDNFYLFIGYNLHKFTPDGTLISVFPVPFYPYDGDFEITPEGVVFAFNSYYLDLLIISPTGVIRTESRNYTNDNGDLFAIYRSSFSNGKGIVCVNSSEGILEISLRKALLTLDEKGNVTVNNDLEIAGGVANLPFSTPEKIIGDKSVVTREFLEKYYKRNHIRFYDFACGSRVDDLELGKIHAQRLMRKLWNCSSFDFSVEEAPLGSDIIIDVRLNDSSIFDVLPIIKDGTFSTLSNPVAVFKNENFLNVIEPTVLVSVHILQVGSVFAGKNLRGQITHKPHGDFGNN
ncbi:hypothetical protein [Pseudotamlana carrageenivorans]|uniref:SMP-30/Gluconolactonase/LRE-like region domain-containing protein n=1 Tax=Pseudotamlana carrageenivorans TaxID=2069432 RepID=A0A2I7SEQ8_9FLAO|nr:hypothetical protein [Tamlana carrageenivorans]AUS04386.1 hypothetical protein C1A40_02365 [Tamlana carrageenivorans]